MNYNSIHHCYRFRFLLVLDLTIQNVFLINYIFFTSWINLVLNFSKLISSCLKGYYQWHLQWAVSIAVSVQTHRQTHDDSWDHCNR